MTQIENSAQPQRPARTGVRARLLDRFFHSGQIVETERVTAGMRRLRLAGPDIRGMEHAPGQQIRVLTGDPDASGLLAAVGDVRTYSIWALDPGAGTLDLCVLDHGDGPGARWGRTAEVGADVRFRGPEGSFTLRADAPYHLFAGEETASVAFGAMLREIAPATTVYGVIETADRADLLPLPRAAELTHVLRGSNSAAESAVLLDAVRALDLPAEPGIAYLAGEARTIQSLRRHLIQERGWPRRAVLNKPFWTPGKKGME